MHGQILGAATAPLSLVDLLSMRAGEPAQTTGFHFLEDDGSQNYWSLADLDRHARRIAWLLDGLNVAGQPVLLLYPAGLEFIAAFFGCLYAGAIAVPAYPPRAGRSPRRLEAVATDCGARVALCGESERSGLAETFNQSAILRELIWKSTDSSTDDSGVDYRPRILRPDALAFLQYTSGSTGQPKGVMVSHGNLMHNLTTIRNAFATERCVGVSWLPMYHDMGLIGMVLESVFSQSQLILSSPMRFLRRPASWLETITQFQATHSGAPNFAYELCVDRVTEDQMHGLDLSSWSFAFSGAETIRKETLDRFAAKFECVGFSRDIFHPCYGLAEATLMVTARTATDPFLHAAPATAPSQAEKTAANGSTQQKATPVGCGTVVGGQKVLIVDPETRRHCPEGQAGEIWVQGPSVAQGYWNRPELSAETFSATVAETGENPFLRTGDLGFFDEQQLFVSGRIKDLIIVRGRKHYPQDIEHTAEKSHAALLPGGGAAFSLDHNGREQVILVHEVRREALRELDTSTILSAISQAVVQEHEARLDVIGLVRPGALSRTTSGKTERYQCRQRYLEGDFEYLDLWRAPASANATEIVNDESHSANLLASSVNGPSLGSPRNGSFQSARVDAACLGSETRGDVLLSAEALCQWITTWLAERLEMRPADIDLNRPLSHYGLDSLMAVELLQDVEGQLGRNLEIGRLIDAASIRALAEELSTTDATSEAQRVQQTCEAPLTGIVQPSWRGPFGDRPDGILVRGESPVREIMPYLMRGRNESIIYQEAYYDLTHTNPWLAQYNRLHPDKRATLFDLFIWAAAYVGHLRPGMNRFISGRRIYQRRGVSISFVAKSRFDTLAPLVTIKLSFPEKDEPFSECVQRINQSTDAACHGGLRTVDRETQLAMRLPRFLLRAALLGYRLLDHCNLLPGKVIENDPLYATLFATNLGSLGLDNAYHHLYEHGTCSLFAAVGLPKKMVIPAAGGAYQTRFILPVRYTLDERIVDGFYSAGCMRLLKSILENPAEFISSSKADAGL